MSFRRVAATLLLAGWAAGGLGRALAGGFEVAPTTVQLSGRGRTALVRITNRGAEPVTLQVQPYDWSEGPQGEALAPSSTLQVSPPMARLAPGAIQTVRLRERGPPPGPSETAHRLLVSELPAPEAAARGEVRVLLQFSIPVFGPPAASAGARAAPSLAWSASIAGGDLVLTCANPGLRHVKLDSITVAPAGASDPAPVTQLAYVLAGATRSWRVPLAAIGAASSLTVRADEGQAGKPLIWTVALQRLGDDRGPGRSR